MTIGGLIERVKSLDIDEVSVSSLRETSVQRAEANRLQMSKGLNSLGEIVGVYTTRQYSAYKQAIGSQAPYGIVDLKLTRSFQEKIKSDVSGLSIITGSTDSKARDLEGRYGPEIYGLSKPYKADYVENDLRPVVNGKIEKITGLKMK